MADFRKLFLALIAGALLFTTVASAVDVPYSCVAVPTQTLARQEGLAEKVGDIVLYCGGFVSDGLRDKDGALKVNIRMTLNSVNQTSNLLNSWSPEPVSDATLILDEGASGFKGYSSLGGSTGPLVPYSDGSQNVYQAVKVQNAENAVEWQGVVIAGPGSDPATIIRLTNVRANVAGLAVNTPISAHVNITTPTSFPIAASDNIIVANVAQATVFSIVSSGEFDQCVDTRGDWIDDAFVLRAREGFAYAFRPVGDANVDNGYPGGNYGNESGFAPISLVAGSLIAYPGTSTVALGQANQGTQIRFLLRGIPPVGTFLKVHHTIHTATGLTLTADDDTPSIAADGTATILYTVTAATPQSLSLPENVDIEVDIRLDHDVPAPADTNIDAHGSLYPISSVGVAIGTGTGSQEPRFIDLDPNTWLLDAFSFNGSCSTTLLFPYITNQAGFDTGLVISNTSTDPMGTAIQHGTCTLNYYGFVGANEAVPELNDAAGQAVSPDIPTGAQLVMLLSAGGGSVEPMGPAAAVACDNCAPITFQGYMIATCNFQYAHGYAFISDTGATKLAQGYLALVIPRRHDTDTGDRATASHAYDAHQNQGETLGN